MGIMGRSMERSMDVDRALMESTMPYTHSVGNIDTATATTAASSVNRCDHAVRYSIPNPPLTSPPPATTANVSTVTDCASIASPRPNAIPASVLQAIAKPSGNKYHIKEVMAMMDCAASASGPT